METSPSARRLTSLLGTRLPIVQGGMTWVSRHPLVAAVSNAGGLGVIGAGAMDPDELRDEVRAVRARTARPFAVNVPLVGVRPDGSDVVAALIDVVLAEDVPIAITGAGSARRFTAALHEAGKTVIHVVPAVELALKACAAGVDAVVAEGYEAGGHVRAEGLTTFALVPQVVRAVSVPVIAAGGIADAGGFVAALALGASGVQLGTRFVATHECNAHPAYKRAILDAAPEGAPVYSKAHHASRGLASPIVQRMIEMERAGASSAEITELRGTGRAQRGCIDGDLADGILPAGSGVGMIHAVLTVAQVMDELVNGYHERVAELRDLIGPAGTLGDGGPRGRVA